MITTILASAILLQSATQAPPPPQDENAIIAGCSSPSHAAFDFWVGEWDVYQAGSDAKIADSRIVRTHGGCAVIESWMPLNGQSGTSLNHFDMTTMKWHQKWVGTGPHAVEFTGGMTEQGLVLVGLWRDILGPGRNAEVRMTYSLNEDGSVRQFGEASSDYGLSWQTSFDLIYRPKQEQAE